MKNFLSTYWIWLLIATMMISEGFAFAYLYPFSGTDMVSIVFGGVGILALIYLAFVSRKSSQ